MDTGSTTGALQGKSWRLNTPDVSSEIIGNEVVAIHLPTGFYFSIENTASALWAAIERGANFEQLLQILTTTYAVPSVQAETDLSAFLAQLTKENLIVEAPASGQFVAPVAGEKQPYLPLKFDKFADLQDLLMIDPIHEVDQRGWPHTKPE